jgi:hypothetical protein
MKGTLCVTAVGVLAIHLFVHSEDIIARLAHLTSGFLLPLNPQNCAFLATVGRKLMRLRAWA